MSDPKITSGLPESAKTIMSLLPIFILVAVALSVLGLFGGFGRSDDYTPTRGREPDEEDEETEDEPEEPSVTVHEKKPKKEPEPEPVNTLEPEVPRKYKKHGKSYRTIRADMMLDEKEKKKNGN